MTTNEAADLLDNLIGIVEDNQGNDYDEALKLAIKSLHEWDYIFTKLNLWAYYCEATVDGVSAYNNCLDLITERMEIVEK